ncbi:Gti1/Pac2 family-domain-containing protein [Crepidotus variabilis]|uniref:Gti1/Pac2 family-domain-containing protein n=1 Tax=Crepidotus variabilis TaxID=179855 RepID=A0A9P6EPM8_9AGAR|nr:Gti1/Pac2 family-domain-containing protein [Crepidotus variabilis]
MSSNPEVRSFTGYVETTVNALRLIHAARQGVIPRINRRLNDAERRTMIKSGAVFVFSVEESGIKRWTDGLLWSPSRIVGNFLVYREINERNSSRNNHQRKPYPTEESPARALVRKHSPDQIPMGFKGHPNEQGTFKAGGLIKKTITVTIEGSDLHLISYYTSEDIRSGRLKRPSSRQDIMGLPMPPHIFRLTNFRVPPKVEIGPDGKPRLVETEEVDPIIDRDCKIEEHEVYNISSSPTWSDTASSSPLIENGGSYANSTMYSFGGQPSGSSSSYGRSAYPSASSMPPPDIGWSPLATALTPSHTMGRRRDLQSDSWPSIQTQSAGRGWTPETHTTSTPSNVYQGRGRRSTPTSYDVGAMSTRRGSDGTPSNNFPLRSTPHPHTTREDALQRLHWHSTSGEPESTREHRRGNSASNNAFPLPSSASFTPHGYHTSPPAASYNSSWTSANDVTMTTPPLQAIPRNHVSYDGSYSNVNSSLASSEDFSKVDQFPKPV